VPPSLAETAGSHHISEWRFRISDLSCGLPPFGRVPSFGLKI
jgi:hypothetical protein